ncbi:nuclear transport factor 2 family protein [Methanosarcina barkeri]|nr:nuclear transport factor 2 family protein [Methanosarcina barkeri]
MISLIEAQKFARELIEAWNSHNIDRILDHYSEDFEMTTPI